MPKTSKKNHTRSLTKDNKREIIAVMVLFVVVYLTMIVYLSYFVATNEQKMINNSYNSRQEIILAKNYRGNIYSSDGTVLAENLNTLIETIADELQNSLFDEKKIEIKTLCITSSVFITSCILINYYCIIPKNVNW